MLSLAATALQRQPNTCLGPGAQATAKYAVAAAMRSRQGHHDGYCRPGLWPSALASTPPVIAAPHEGLLLQSYQGRPLVPLLRWQRHSPPCSTTCLGDCRRAAAARPQPTLPPCAPCKGAGRWRGAREWPGNAAQHTAKHPAATAVLVRACAGLRLLPGVAATQGVASRRAQAGCCPAPRRGTHPPASNSMANCKCTLPPCNSSRRSTV